MLVGLAYHDRPSVVNQCDYVDHAEAHGAPEIFSFVLPVPHPRGGGGGPVSLIELGPLHRAVALSPESL